MIISKTPFRVSFFGGGTDLPEYFSRNKGAVISTAITKYIYHSVSYHSKQINDNSIKIAYSKIENLNDLNEIKHAPFREIIRESGIKNDIEIHVVSDLPSYTGLGSSSSFTVGLINILNEYKNKKISKMELAKKAIHIERNILKESVGYQDQTIAAFGGFNLIEFSNKDNIKVTPIDLSNSFKSELSSSLMLFFTGIKRKAQNIEINKINNINKISTELKKIYEITFKAMNVLENSKSISEFGFLLNETWNLKKSLGSDVSNKIIDQMYDDAIKAGAIGGKLLGAGGGGFLLLVVPEEKKSKVRINLKNFYEINFEMCAHGAEIILNDH